MGVHVDPARGDQQPVGVDVALGRALLAADRRDAAVRDRHVAGKCRFAGAIDDLAAANDDVVHGRHSLDLWANDAPAGRVVQWPCGGLFTGAGQGCAACGHAAHAIVRGDPGRYASPVPGVWKGSCMVEVVREPLQFASFDGERSTRSCTGRRRGPRPGW